MRFNRMQFPTIHNQTDTHHPTTRKPPTDDGWFLVLPLLLPHPQADRTRMMVVPSDTDDSERHDRTRRYSLSTVSTRQKGVDALKGLDDNDTTAMNDGQQRS